MDDANAGIDAASRRYVATRWQRACGHWSREPVLEPVLTAYADPRRHYHNIRHIADCLYELDRALHLWRDPHAATVAVILHDAVYDATRRDNEARSAEWAGQILGSIGAPAEYIERVAEMIAATTHFVVAPDPDARLVADIDLAILGALPDEFDRYERAIRLEYGHVPDDDFAAGRAKVLRHFLDRPAIYSTPDFHEQYEQSARRNLARSLARLAAPAAG